MMPSRMFSKLSTLEQKDVSVTPPPSEEEMERMEGEKVKREDARFQMDEIILPLLLSMFVA